MKLEELTTSYNFDTDTYYFLLPFGLGDSMVMCGLKDALKNKYSKKIHFIIKPAHEVIMNMFANSDYTICEIDLTKDKKYLFELGCETPIPQCGKIFVAHPEFLKDKYALNKLNTLEFNFYQFYLSFLELDLKTQLRLPVWYPKVSKELEEKIQEIAPFEKLVLIAPEAYSSAPISDKYWDTLVDNLTTEGFKVIENSTKVGTTKAIQVSMSLEDCIAVALRCYKVYSLRSGLCDLIYTKGGNLTVLYPDINTLSIYGLNEVFKMTDIKEHIISNYFDIENKPKPLVTVVTAVYNLIQAERKDDFIKCLESVHAQTYGNIEHLVIDGASTDGTLDLLKQYSDLGWIKYISEFDSGIYDAMNKGINNAKGKYLIFLNSDDYFNPNAISLSVEYLEKHNADFSFGKAKMFNLQNDTSLIFYPNESIFISSMPFSHQTMLCKTSVLRENLFDTRFKIGSDLDLIIRLYLKGSQSVYVPYVLANYNMLGFSGTNREAVYQDYAAIFQKNYENIYPLSMQDALSLARNCNPTAEMVEKVQKIIKKNNKKMYYQIWFELCPYTQVSNVKLFGFIKLYGKKEERIDRYIDIKNYKFLGIPFYNIRQKFNKRKYCMLNIPVLTVEME